MIAAATQATQNASSWSLDKLPFGWFDVALILVIAFGVWRGRKNGMTKEILPMFQWLATVFVCGLGYEMVGQLILNLSGWGRTACVLLGYFSLMFLVYLVFPVPAKDFPAAPHRQQFFWQQRILPGNDVGWDPLRLPFVCRARSAQRPILHGGGNPNAKRL